ncbi:MAG: hypothetical protein KGZ65_14505 [Sphingomonadales bacterium]|nr:hypothetical protein [Sphingomonadales bacterium]
MNDSELARRISICASSQDWPAIKSYLDELQPETAFVFLRVLGERLPIEADLEAAIADASDVPGLIVAGAALMMRATRIRGMDIADMVEAQNWEPYFVYHQQAERLLCAAVTAQPGNGLAAAWLMAATVDSDDELKAEVCRLLMQATQVPLSGYSKLLSAMTKKWGGSHEAMWRVARECANLNLPWSGALIAKAHYEQWLYLDLMDERPAAQSEADRYFRDPAIRNELLAISSAIDAAHGDDPYEAVYAHDVLAAVLAEAKERKIATRHLRRVGKFGDPALLTGGPWWRSMLIRLIKGLPPW